MEPILHLIDPFGRLLFVQGLQDHVRFVFKGQISRILNCLEKRQGFPCKFRLLLLLHTEVSSDLSDLRRPEKKPGQAYKGVHFEFASWDNSLCRKKLASQFLWILANVLVDRGMLVGQSRPGHLVGPLLSEKFVH